MNRPKTTIIVLLLITTLLSANLWAEGQKEEKLATISFWNGYTGPDRPAVEQIAADFNAAFPNIDLEMEIMPWDSLFQKLMPALIAGSGPDLMGYDVSRLPEFAKAGKLEPIDGYFKDSELDRNVLVKSLMDASVYKGSLYGVPMGFASMCMYYNKDHFNDAGLNPAQPPANLEELRAAWKRLLKKDAAGNVIRYPQAWGIKLTVPMIPVIIWDHGAEIVTDGGKSGLDDPKAIKAMDFLADGFLNLRVSPIGLTGQEADNLFAAGKASIEWNGPWAINGFRGAGINLGIAEVPAGPEGRVTWSSGTVIVMNKDSKAKDASWKFMEFWNSSKTQKYWAKTVAFPPTRLDLVDNPTLKENPDLVLFMRAARYGKVYLPGIAGVGKIENEVLVPLYESIFYGQKGVKEAMLEAHRKLNAILAE